MIFKCKMCGGDIEQIENTNIGKCLYCKSVMTLPNLDNEKIINLYNRANDLRLANDFDKAREVYESILEIDNNQIEAHWGILLCKYGIEYIDDPNTKEKIPTCHRTNDYSILLDQDFKIIKKESFGEALKLYEKEAKQIDEIQKNILAISIKEKPYDIFICYKESDEKGERTHDSVIAQDIYDKLVEQGYKVFFARITLEDKLGQEFEPYIYSALKSAKAMLVVGTKEEHFNAVWVKNEWSRYLEMMKSDKDKVLIPVYSNMNVYHLPSEFAMLQAQNMDKIGALQDLIHGLEKIVQTKNKNVDISNEMYRNFKKMYEEEKKLEEEQKSKKDIPVLLYSQGINKLFILSSIIISSIMAIVMFMSISTTSFYHNSYINSSLSDTSVTDRLIIFQVLVGVLTTVAFFMGISSKKGNKSSKYIYFVNILIEFYVCIASYNLNFHLSISYYIIVLANILLLILNPIWHIEKNESYVSTEEEKVEIDEENKIFEEEFNKVDKSKSKLVMLIISIIILIISLYIEKLPIKSQANKKDPTKEQLIIINNYINIREKPSVVAYINGQVYKKEIYTILDSKTDKSNITWYKIKTEKGIEGYISAGEDNKYIKLVEQK